MLSEPKLKLLNDFVQLASIEELIYASGFIEGYRLKESGSLAIATAQTDKAVITVKPTIIYATETGNAKKVATQLLAQFKQQKINAKSVDITQFNFSKLTKETFVLFVISTQGDGDLPASALACYNELLESTVDLKHLSYAILGLGDTAYPLFCNAAILMDEVLIKKGAKAVMPIAKADVDYSDCVKDWERSLLSLLKNAKTISGKENAAVLPTPKSKQKFNVTISHKVILNDIGSNKTTYHIELDTDEIVHYQPGDALGLIPRNKEEDIKAILGYFEIAPDAIFNRQEESKTAFDHLQQLNIKGLSKRNAAQVAALFNATIDTQQIDLFDLLGQMEKHNCPDFAKVLQVLQPIAPRLYSIASSQAAHDGQIHLTVNLNTFEVAKISRLGLASDYLVTMPVGSQFEAYIHVNNNFRLPEDDKDIIMIGPGTGIAPFRSFLAERDARAAVGKNWLFFGEQHFVNDFYYQTEIQEWLSTGTLNKLSTAFSRDQKEKIYVQDRIREQAASFNEWLEAGAYIYICGQKDPMSRDVENIILEVLQAQRNIDRTTALAVIETMEAEGRYLKDVY
ncbi:MAG: flavodoxin domain-containing protein [Taibaiella sp.]|nr:flavodoxin domain-containing protein [Taibaiella sp.]